MIYFYNCEKVLAKVSKLFYIIFLNSPGGDEMTFGDFLKDLRIRKGLKLREVEESTGVSNSYLSQVETGKRNPPHPDILKKLAKVYEVSVKELMEKAGYLEEQEQQSVSEQEEVNRVFDFVIKDPNYKFGTRLDGKSSLDLEAKRFVIEMYEKATGRKLLGTAE